MGGEEDAPKQKAIYKLPLRLFPNRNRLRDTRHHPSRFPNQSNLLLPDDILRSLSLLLTNYNKIKIYNNGSTLEGLCKHGAVF